MALAFLITDDLKTSIYQKFIDESTADYAERIEQFEKQRIAYIKSKLSKRYDVSDIFNQTGSDRDDLIVKYLADMVIYDMVRTNAARKVPENFGDKYDEAVEWLNDLRDGNENPESLPLLSSDSSTLLHGSGRNESFYI